MDDRECLICGMPPDAMWENATGCHEDCECRAGVCGHSPMGPGWLRHLANRAPVVVGR